jgi:hypothetical protein
LYTDSEGVRNWSIVLSGFDTAQLDSIIMVCRNWRTNRRTALALPPRWHEDLSAKDGTIVLSADPIILEHLGDPVYWLKRKAGNVFIPDPTSTLAGALRRELPDLSESIRIDVHGRPLHVANARTGRREHLTYVPPHAP